MKKKALSMNSDNIEIKDKSGKVRIFMGMSENDEPVIRLLDSDGKTRISISAHDDSSYIMIHSKLSKRNIRLWVWEDEYNAAGIQLADGEGSPRVQLQLEENCYYSNVGTIALCNKDATRNISLCFNEEKDRVISTFTIEGATHCAYPSHLRDVDQTSENSAPENTDSENRDNEVSKQ